MNPDRHLQAFVDALYAEAADADPLGFLAPLDAALRQTVEYSAASFLQFAPPDGTVAAAEDYGVERRRGILKEGKASRRRRQHSSSAQPASPA